VEGVDRLDKTEELGNEVPMSTIDRERLVERYEAGELTIQEFVREYYQLLGERPRLEKILAELQTITDWGQRCLRIWGQIYDVIHGDDPELIALAFRYFTFTSAVLVQTAVLQAAKLVEKHSDSVNLCYFFNVLLNEGRKHFEDDWGEVKEAVKNDRAQVQELFCVVSRIKVTRDKEIAHRDRCFVNSIMSNSTQVEVQELQGLFVTVQEMLDRYHFYYFGSWPNRSALVEDSLPGFGPAGLEDVFHLLLKALEDECIQDVSEHVREVRAQRESRLWAEKVMKDLSSGESE
jgi:hypothetical protein